MKERAHVLKDPKHKEVSDSIIFVKEKSAVECRR